MDPDASTNTGDQHLVLHTPSTFHAFPYETPYSIQTDLMRHLYSSIENSSIAIVESPTGTGKTLTLLTSALTWLNDNKERSRKGQLATLHKTLKNNSSGASEPDWVIEQSLARHKRALDLEEEEFTERLVNARKREEIIRRKEKGRVIKKARGAPIEKDTPKEDKDDRFLPEDGGDDGGAIPADDDYILENMSPLVREEMKRLRARAQTASGTAGEEDPICTKVYFASRTHTQLSQAISELRKLKLKLKLAHPDITTTTTTSSSSSSSSTQPKVKIKIGLEGGQEKEEEEEEESRIVTRAVSLGSRKNLCINDALRSSSGPDLDEACRELNTRPTKESRCPFLPGVDEESRLLDFRDHALASPRDIEDLVILGRELSTCPYYGSRKAINRAEFVALPYNLLLQDTAREALGIDLKGHVVIIDEAHNLIDTVLSINSHTLSSSILQLSLSQLKTYYTKFRTRFSPKHALHLKRLVFFVSALDSLCKTWGGEDQGEGVEATTTSTTNAAPTAAPGAGAKAKTGVAPSFSKPNNGATAATKMKARGLETTTMMTVGELVSKLGSKVDGFNLIEVVKYLRESKIARKITSYCDHVVTQEQSKGAASSKDSRKKTSTSPPLHAVEAFLLVLVNANEQGRIFVERDRSTPSNSSAERINVTLKYQLLDPERAFEKVVEDARCVVLAGGTMTPMSDFRIQLFPSVVEDRIATFSCGHVIPQTNLQTLVITQGPRKTDLQFKFDKRGDKDLMIELGQMVVNLATIIPQGLVIFFPSYAFLDQACKVWQEAGVLARLGTKKTVFLEPKQGTEVEAVLREYAACIRSSIQGGSGSPRGAMLAAVVGGKVSEGLNFTDELARAVVVIGLPFANLGSRELQERMRFVRERPVVSSKASITSNNAKSGVKDAGLELYENMCMKAVNQSIGRAIRHQNDWASLILIDQRYSTPRIQSKLPQWIRGDIVITQTWGKALQELGGFYRRKKE